MRDNPNHSAPLMGGMWGAKLNSTLRKDFTDAFKQILKDHMAYIERGNGGWDQMCLRRWTNVVVTMYYFWLFFLHNTVLFFQVWKMHD